MTKTQKFRHMHLARNGMRELDTFLTRPGGIFEEHHFSRFLIVSANGAHWEFETAEEFLADYQPLMPASYERAGGFFKVAIVNYADGDDGPYSTITVMAPDKITIEKIWEIVESYRPISVAKLCTENLDRVSVN